MMILITTLINIVKDWLKENRNYRQVIFSIIEDIIIKLIIYFILYNLYLFVYFIYLFFYYIEKVVVLINIVLNKTIFE